MDPQVTTAPTNTFEAVLRNQRKGKMSSELSDKLQELTRACMSVRKPGKLKLTISISPTGEAFSLVDEIEIKCPQPTKQNSLFYATDDGVLVRDNPDQRELTLAVVESPKAAAI